MRNYSRERFVQDSNNNSNRSNESLRVVGWATCSCRINPFKPQFAQIELINVHIDDTHRIGFGNIVDKQFWQQRALRSVLSLYESLDLTPLINARSIWRVAS